MSQLKELAADIDAALAKSHRGYTIRGSQMLLVIQALHVLDVAMESKSAAINGTQQVHNVA